MAGQTNAMMPAATPRSPASTQASVFHPPRPPVKAATRVNTLRASVAVEPPRAREGRERHAELLDGDSASLLGAATGHTCATCSPNDLTSGPDPQCYGQNSGARPRRPTGGSG